MKASMPYVLGVTTFLGTMTAFLLASFAHNMRQNAASGMGDIASVLTSPTRILVALVVAGAVLYWSR